MQHILDGLVGENSPHDQLKCVIGHAETPYGEQMNNYTRKHLAAQFALDLRYWVEQTGAAGMLRPGVSALLGRVADAVTLDAQLNLIHPPTRNPPLGGEEGSEHP